MKETFIKTNFRPGTLAIIDQANIILDEYRLNRIQLTLRQLYYQFIARDLFPESWINAEGTKNNTENYKKLGGIISNARNAGLIDWNDIDDRARSTMLNNHWDSPNQIIQAAAYQYYIDRWEDQDYHIEVMSEKDAATSVLWPVCQELDVRFTANKGYASSSLFYEVGQRLRVACANGKNVTVLYLGDHDPSGIDMTRDVEERLSMYARNSVEVIRLALNFDQVELWNPPENPAKETDPRAGEYKAEFGDSSWELDAVEPLTLRDLVREAITERIDQDLWDETVMKEEHSKAKLLEFAKSYKE